MFTRVHTPGNQITGRNKPKPKSGQQLNTNPLTLYKVKYSIGPHIMTYLENQKYIATSASAHAIDKIRSYRTP